MRRLIQNEIEDQLATLILKNEVSSDGRVNVDKIDGKITVG